MLEQAAIDLREIREKLTQQVENLGRVFVDDQERAFARQRLSAVAADLVRSVSERLTLLVSGLGAYVTPEKLEQIDEIRSQLSKIQEIAETGLGNVAGSHVTDRFNVPVHTLRRAIAVADIPEATVRNWLTRRQLPLAANKGRASGEWRSFSERDILVLALAGKLYRLGVPITNFTEICGPIIRDLEEIGANSTETGATHPIFVIWRSGENWRVEPRRRPNSAEMPPVAIVIDPLALARETLSELYSPSRSNTLPIKQNLQRKRAAS